MATPERSKRWWQAKDVLTHGRHVISALATLVFVVLKQINIVRKADDE